MTYGDGVSDVDITKLIKFHREHGATPPSQVSSHPGRFGAIQLEGNLVTAFAEKPEERFRFH